MNLGQPIRMAGAALKNVLTNPAAVKNVASQVAADTAMKTAAQQIVPRLLGGKPGLGMRMNLMQAGTEAAVGIPAARLLQKAGVPESFASPASSILGAAAGAALINRFSNQIDPEIVQENHPDFHQLYAVQQMNAAMKQNEHDMKIQEIYARNYNPPSFIYHKSTGDTASTAQNIANSILKSSQF